MAKQKKDFGLIVEGSGAFVTSIKKIASRLKVPFEAFDRLGSPEGEVTIEKMVQLIKEDYEAEQKPAKAISPYRESAGGDKLETITISSLAGSELIAEAKKVLGLTYIDSDFTNYYYMEEKNGKTYEVMTWKPGREVVPGTAVRAYFKKRGFTGNTMAFIAWVTKSNPEGYHATIPEDDRLFRDDHGDLYAPRFVRGDGRRELNLRSVVRSAWDDHWTFVAFREVIQKA